MPGRIIRVTLFKVPSKESQEKIAENYKVLSETAVKDGKPYILSLHAGPLFEDHRSAGFTFASKSEFASVADMKYYDDECEAHKVLKAKGTKLGIEGVMMVYFDPVVIA